MGKNNKYYTPKFHLMPPQGWLNDPNGLCQLDGKYHIFFQYSPDDPHGADKYWGHYETKNFIDYNYTGIFLSPDNRADKDGVYSGSAFVEDGIMYIYYTGNVKLDGDYDYIYNGREGNTILVTTRDGLTSTKKEWLLKPSDYPKNLSNHVRDPKVFKENDSYYMVLGARTNDDKGCVMLYKSIDKQTWSFDHFIQKDDFGFMWECPDLFRLNGNQYLSLSPQGLASEDYRFQNIYQSGYFISEGELLTSGDCLGEFNEWDYGFDFYAPQTFEDEKGRRILIGWMGVPDVEYDHDPTIDEGWQHMLTLPRKLESDSKTKRIRQMPIEEINALRQNTIFDEGNLSEKTSYTLHDTYELLLSEIDSEKFSIIFDDGFELSYNVDTNVMTFEFTNKALGCGRTIRRLHFHSDETLNNLRIFSDTCCLEIYINDGAYVFTTKIFRSLDAARKIKIDGKCGLATAYELGEFHFVGIN